MNAENRGLEPGADGARRGGVSPVAEVTEEMFADLYQQEAGRLLCFLVRRVGESEAPELRDRALTEFFVWWPAHPEHPAPVATLYMIAQRRAADHVARCGRSLPVEGGDLQELAWALRRHRDQYAAADLRIDLRRALAGLDERERRALQLRHLDEVPVAVCAALLGTGIDNTKKILKKALVKLRLSPGLAAYDSAVTTTPQEVRK